MTTSLLELAVRQSWHISDSFETFPNSLRKGPGSCSHIRGSYTWSKKKLRSPRYSVMDMAEKMFLPSLNNENYTVLM